MIKNSLFRKFFRAKTVVWVVFAMLLIPFALFFTAGNSFDSNAMSGAGTVFGKSIPWNTFYAHQQWVRLWYPDEFNRMDSSVTQPIIEQETWDRLILLEEANRQGIKINDNDLAQFIRTMPLFLENGEFVSSRYYRLLEMLNMSPRQFEDLLKSTLAVEQLVARHRAPEVEITEPEIAEAYAKAYEKARVRIALFKPEDFAAAAEAEVSDEAVKIFFEQHPELFIEPERYSFEYAGLNIEKLQASIQISDEDIQAAWDKEQSRNTQSTAQALQELADSSEETATPVLDDAAKERLRTQILAQKTMEARNTLSADLDINLQSATEWQALIDQHQLDSPVTVGPVSTEESWTQGEPAVSMLQGLTAADLNQIEVFDTEQGVFIARLIEKTDGGQQSFAQSYEAAKAAAVREKMGQLASQKAEETQKAAETALQESTVEAVAASLNLNLIVPGPIHRQSIIPGLGSVPSLNNAALSLEAGKMSGIIGTPHGPAFVMVEERLEADKEEFDQYKEEIETGLRAEKQQAVFMDWLIDVRSRAQLKSNLEALKAQTESPEASS